MTGIHILAPTKIGKLIAYQYPAFGKGQPTLFWAQDGFVCFEDRRPDANPRCGKISWQDAGERVLAVSATMPRRDEDPKKHFRFERERQLKWIEAMVEVIRDAKNQGGPFDNMKRKPQPKRPRVIGPELDDDFMAANQMMRAGERQDNGVVRLGKCDF